MGGSGTPEHESVGERLDREVEELMQELRAVIPGAQVLFGLLLTVAFTQRFTELGDTERHVFFATFVSALLALVLLLGPASFHRVRFRQRDKERLLRVGNREMIAALVFVALSIGGVAYLVTSIVITTTVAAVTSGLLMTAAALVWWVIPLARRRDGRGHG
jgi:amino acid transporter